MRIYTLFLILNFFLLAGCSSVMVQNGRRDTSMARKSDVVRAFASSERSENTSEKAFDNDKNTRWESVQGANPSWLAFEMRPGRIIETLKINWAKNAAREYEILTTSDGNIWDTAGAVFDGQEEESRGFEINPVKAKYVKIMCAMETNPGSGYAISEVEINPVVILPEKKVGLSAASASSEGGAGKASDAIDGNIYTRWESVHQVDPSVLTVKLASLQEIRAVKILWEKAAAKRYRIEVSEDGENWTTVSRVNDGKEAEDKIISFAPVKASYIRVTGLSRLTEWGYSIFEIEVYK